MEFAVRSWLTERWTDSFFVRRRRAARAEAALFACPLCTDTLAGLHVVQLHMAGEHHATVDGDSLRWRRLPMDDETVE